jgi:hypothetical protein
MRALIALLLLTTIAAAQQAADPIFLTKAVAAIQQQRNQALDMQASAEAREAILKEDVLKLKARVEELEKAAAKSPVGAPAPGS